ncbi:uncharacterized protein EV420DRAFT_57844 [Desarmillaria tabescens]|uniref:Uncharacterized protein n=1 Tax=Armillaria tabescens TaxID=1929756 RepID=A0AA39NQD9_ARMTA|nr:uncharacterized protein EV420DRAFT_57844 [Desarmillaria tabescens]KAK0469699.1 hypothetical protein EV420DRAFT_57844 [Desarmillaria tabescens]
MSLFANVLGFSLFGLAARLGQLGIQKRNLFDSASMLLSIWHTRLTATNTDMTAHAVSMGAWGAFGYLAWQWDQKSSGIIAQKKLELAERRQARQELAEELAAAHIPSEGEH